MIKLFNSEDTHHLSKYICWRVSWQGSVRMEREAGTERASTSSLMRRMRHRKDIAISGANAKVYDRQGRRYRQAEFRELAEQLAKWIPEDASILEVASGSGYLAIELHRLGRTHLIGTDISQDQVDIAAANAREAGVPIEFSVASVLDIPRPEGSFDFVLCFAAFKNFSDPAAALMEMRRILAPGGQVIIGDMYSDIPDQAIEEYLDGQNIRGLNRIVLRVIFRFLRKGAYSHAELDRLISGADFSSHEMTAEGIAFLLRLTK